MSDRATTGRPARRLRRATRNGAAELSLPESATPNGAAELSSPEPATGNGAAESSSPEPATPNGSAGVALRAPVGETAPAARPVGLYSTYVGKKYAMAISGALLMLFVAVHMLGNLKLYFGAGSMDSYSAWLRNVGEPVLPRETLLWTLGIVLIAAVVIHIYSAYALTLVNRRARPEAYRSPRDYVAASFASRTMRWTGIIVVLFVVFHLLDLTWGAANPDFRTGDPYHNVVASFQRWPVAIAYVIANLALATHLYHGAWSLFQSMGWVFRWRRKFAVAFAAVIAAGNVSFPIAVLTGVVG
jgi:succinate dehydrogenase / fumarate reductase cytochrome b subunit